MLLLENPLYLKLLRNGRPRKYCTKPSSVPKPAKEIIPKATQPNPRFNEVNVQMLSKPIYDQIFKGAGTPGVDVDVVERCVAQLREHKMAENFDLLRDVDFVIPPLEGDVEQHFWNIAERQAKPYRNLIEKLLMGTPPVPKKWMLRPGWTKYPSEGDPEPVDYPAESAMVFDVEVCMQVGKSPTLATAVTDRAWYGWVSQSLIDGTSTPQTNHHYSQDVLIPLESDNVTPGYRLNEKLLRPKVVVGHNVSYDRSRIKEQYWLERTGTRFIDTMSLHTCVSGVTSYQRAMLKSSKENKEDEHWKRVSSLNSLGDVYKLYCGKQIDKATRDLFVEGNLADIKNNFQLTMDYCSSDVMATYEVLKVLYPMFLERFAHPVTLAGMLELSTAYLPVNSNWEKYCKNSTETYEDLKTEGQLLLAKRADQACQLLHDDKYKEDIWMWDEDWELKHVKLKSSKGKIKKLKNGESGKMVDVKSSSNVVKDRAVGLEDDLKFVYSNVLNCKTDYDELKNKHEFLTETYACMPKVKVLLPGYPNWYRKLCTREASVDDWIPGAQLISTSMRITPKLLSLTWEGYPLHFVAGLGWGFLVPFNSEKSPEGKLPLHELLRKCPLLTDKHKEVSSDTINIVQTVEEHISRKDYYRKVQRDNTKGLYKGTGVWTDTTIENCCMFFKLPHKNGANQRVGNPLSKDFLNKFSENVLAGETESAEQVLSIARKISYWRNNKARIADQMVVWLKDHNLPPSIDNTRKSYGAILPQVVVCGTLTRRAMEPTWMTASNANPERIGSELRAMVQSPPGYSIVGADVDSQELWIASMIGDAHYAGIHGATPFGWMTLSGNKTYSTDMHSTTAKAVGISRDHAKVINYARIYGAGQNFAQQLLKQFNPSISDSEARKKANKMFELTKGRQIFRLKRDYLSEYADKPYTKWNARDMAARKQVSVEDMFLKPAWVGGTESSMFNRLEEIAGSDVPRTPFLNCQLSRALQPNDTSNDRFLPTRVNWVVQSGAVDFLHLMLVCMRWILKDRARFCLSFHDEIRYLVPDEYKYQSALAMHVTNLLTRSFCCARLGFNDLPQSVAFFSSVEVDTVLRKNSNDDCKTPSNPHGLENGYGIPNGESLDIYQAINKANGRDENWYR